MCYEECCEQELRIGKPAPEFTAEVFHNEDTKRIHLKDFTTVNG